LTDEERAPLSAWLHTREGQQVRDHCIHAVCNSSELKKTALALGVLAHIAPSELFRLDLADRSQNRLNLAALGYSLGSATEFELGDKAQPTLNLLKPILANKNRSMNLALPIQYWQRRFFPPKNDCEVDWPTTEPPNDSKWMHLVANLAPHTVTIVEEERLSGGSSATTRSSDKPQSIFEIAHLEVGESASIQKRKQLSKGTSWLLDEPSEKQHLTQNKGKGCSKKRRGCCI